MCSQSQQFLWGKSHDFVDPTVQNLQYLARPFIYKTLVCNSNVRGLQLQVGIISAYNSATAPITPATTITPATQPVSLAAGFGTMLGSVMPPVAAVTCETTELKPDAMLVAAEFAFDAMSEAMAPAPDCTPDATDLMPLTTSSTPGIGMVISRSDSEGAGVIAGAGVDRAETAVTAMDRNIIFVDTILDMLMAVRLVYLR
jgi:hypothetical protein